MEDQGGVSEGCSSKGKRIQAHIPQMWAFLSSVIRCLLLDIFESCCYLLNNKPHFLCNNGGRCLLLCIVSLQVYFHCK